MIPYHRDTLKAYMESCQNPSISIYLPVARVGAETRQSPVRLRALLKRAEEILKGQNWRQPLIEKIISPMEHLISDTLFWEYQQEGLAIFADETGMKTQLLPIPVNEAIYVSDHFYTRPLIPLLTHDREFFLLALALSEAKVYLGSRYCLEPYPVEGLPGSLQDILTTYSVEKQLGLHSGSSVGGSGGAVFHGFDNAKDIEKIRIEEYFRQVDAALHRALPGQRQRPLVLACVDYLFPLFRQISKYTPLLEQHVSGSPDTIPADVLLRSAWAIVQPLVEQDQEKAWTAGLSLLGSPRVSVNIRQIIAAATHGRVETLFLPAGRQIPGRYDPETEKAVRLPTKETAMPADSVDLLNVAAVFVFLKGGSVYEADSGTLPENADALAVMRY
jgi:hypothetical protein